MHFRIRSHITYKKKSKNRSYKRKVWTVINSLGAQNIAMASITGHLTCVDDHFTRHGGQNPCLASYYKLAVTISNATNSSLTSPIIWKPQFHFPLPPPNPFFSLSNPNTHKETLHTNSTQVNSSQAYISTLSLNLFYSNNRFVIHFFHCLV